MDPNETLRMIRLYVERLNELRDAKDRNDDAAVRALTASETLEDMAYALAEYTEAMDGWLVKGGFHPQDWT
jgi:hypothetical protein